MLRTVERAADLRALDEIEELKAMVAELKDASERPGVTGGLSPAWLRLAKQGPVEWEEQSSPETDA